MKIIHYPEHAFEKESGSVGRFLKNLRKDRPDLWSMVNRTLNSVADGTNNLERLKSQGWVGNISYSKYSLFEFRIPPRKKGGVVRLYFAHKKGTPKTIVILSAELKKKSEVRSEKIKQAEQRYQEVCL